MDSSSELEEDQDQTMQEATEAEPPESDECVYFLPEIRRREAANGSLAITTEETVTTSPPESSSSKTQQQDSGQQTAGSKATHEDVLVSERYSMYYDALAVPSDHLPAKHLPKGTSKDPIGLSSIKAKKPEQEATDQDSTRYSMYQVPVVNQSDHLPVKPPSKRPRKDPSGLSPDRAKKSKQKAND